MCFTIYELALNPEIQDRLREEIANGVADNDGELTYELLSEFKYLDMVINESLRKFPPAFFLTRVCRKDFKIPGTEMVIPKDTDINVNIYSIHRDPEYYPEPEKFDPERFTAENIKTRPACTFIPFGLGPRRCIGKFLKLIKTFHHCQKKSHHQQLDALV
jgi:cytochrome P450 family 6